MESIDPLVLTLRAIQSAANNQHSEAPMTWSAINHAGRAYGAPEIDYDRFAARWDTDPILKSLVARFDGRGLVIKTQGQDSEHEMGQGDDGAAIDQMAKRAAEKEIK